MRIRIDHELTIHHKALCLAYDSIFLSVMDYAWNVRNVIGEIIGDENQLDRH